MPAVILLVVILAGLTWLALEVLTYVYVSRGLGQLIYHDPSSGYVPAALLIVVALIAGIKIAKTSITQIMPSFLAGGAGRHVMAALGGVLLAIPGFITDIPGLLLLLPPVQRGLGSLGQKILAAVVQRQMKTMFGGKAGTNPFAGGMPFPGGGFPGGPFPGMAPRVDESIRRAPKTYTVNPEK